MELELNIDVDDTKSLTNKLENVFKIATEKCGMAWLNATTQILLNKGTIDTGEFINSIHYKVRKRKDIYTMTGRDAVKYGVYIEKGTVAHWVPFYEYIGKGMHGESMYDRTKPILADWGHRVLGLSEGEMLKMGGMKVKNSGTNAFEMGLIHLMHVHKEIFKETFEENMK